MSKAYDYKKFFVLYVDDEEKSLKYFRKYLEKDFSILTAPTPSDAWQQIERNAGKIGVVITDQRMPIETGVSLLRRLRQAYPGIIRILTTAYADMDSAIEAVNSGAIYKYVVKPWEARDLRGALMGSMEFFILRRERDLLLREKLSHLHRFVFADRVRNLITLAASLSHRFRNSLEALKSYLVLSPIRTKIQDQDVDPGNALQDLWLSALRDNRRMLQSIQKLTGMLDEGANRTEEGKTKLEDLIYLGIQNTERETAAFSAGKVLVELAPGLPQLKVHPILMERFFELLLLRMVRPIRQGHVPSGTIELRAVPTTLPGKGKGIQVIIRGKGSDFNGHEKEDSSLFSTFSIEKGRPMETGVDLLAALLLLHHHDGELRALRRPPEGPGFEIFLPLEPSSAERPTDDEEILEALFEQFENEDLAESRSCEPT